MEPSLHAGVAHEVGRHGASVALRLGVELAAAVLADVDLAVLVLHDPALGLPPVEDVCGHGVVGVLCLQAPDVRLELGHRLLLAGHLLFSARSLLPVFGHLGLGAAALGPDLHEELALAVLD